MGSSMLKMLTKRLIKTGTFLGVCVSIPSAIWFSLTYQPSYYRAMVSLPHEQREISGRENRRHPRQVTGRERP